jgi:hypothetical protein
VEVDSLRQKLGTATGSKREQLKSQLAETEAELDLAKARSDQVHTMAEFLNQAGSTGLGKTGCKRKFKSSSTQPRPPRPHPTVVTPTPPSNSSVLLSSPPFTVPISSTSMPL